MTGSLTHTHIPATATNKKQLGTSHHFCVQNSDLFEWLKKKSSHHFLKEIPPTHTQTKDVLLSNVHVQQRPIHYSKNGIGKGHYPGIRSSDPSRLPRRWWEHKSQSWQSSMYRSMPIPCVDFGNICPLLRSIYDWHFFLWLVVSSWNVLPLTQTVWANSEKERMSLIFLENKREMSFYYKKHTGHLV